IVSITMAGRLGVLDYLHRAVVYSCVGISIWGIGMGVAVHRDTLRRGRGEQQTFACFAVTHVEHFLSMFE
ncbi:hypothetical protein DFP72DRAFT_804392, partial [Ephemerocybe angulata]